MPAPRIARVNENFWETISRLVGWLDGESDRAPEMDRLLRIMKVTEESGEVAEAVAGATGQNPRKGVTNGWDKVSAELVDVILTAAVALRTIEGEGARAVFEAHVGRVADRSLKLPSAR
jgi:NTP pyrophosphatase (non-canonical NTP hydrolase)